MLENIYPRDTTYMSVVYRRVRTDDIGEAWKKGKKGAGDGRPESRATGRIARGQKNRTARTQAKKKKKKKQGCHL